ncbi:peptidase S41-like protein [Pontibacter ummariensis]|uniref:N-terminal domain of Peptidase_S41 n=1 Tax=Pontibacter ummariensis TaxID=1610492 RepID=A0A239KMF8_9BACT|nr:S41 family peptidase [Pontibacter ummariensis]PRY05324.1 peptidase S41-like protein [Pontibacter ummariensis]SNT19245.1 N-terminal domain of Peptidase_S41 [Pontibacter ummariensis]
MTKHFLLIFATLTVALTLTVCCGTEQQSNAFDLAKAHKAIERLAKLLEEDFIYPEVGKAYAKMLRENVASNTYSKFKTHVDFTSAVTADLQAVHPEGHLKLQHQSINVSNNTMVTSETNGVGKAGWIAPGIAYISLHGFTGNTEEYNQLLIRLQAVLDDLSTAKTLIIDARPHVGGSLQEMDIMFSYFFDKPTALVLMDTRLDVEKRGGNPLTEGKTLKRIAGPEGIVRRVHQAVPSNKDTALSKAQIFLLISNKTASAGEHLSLALKRTKRATLIGETTAGAGHFGRTTSLGGGYQAFIPVGRTFDPDTEKGWEQTGIEPHIKTAAEQAFDEALKRAGVNQSAAKKALESLKVNQ